MLEYLRNASEKPIAKILISILAFSFVGWGVAEWIFGNVVSDNALVHVGEAEVSVQQFNSEKSRELARLTKEQQRDIYTDAETQNAFSRQVMTRLATEKMVENRANDLGLVVSDAAIAHEIREIPEFQINGEFSTFAFDTVLMNSGYSEADFADVLRNQILRSRVLQAVARPVAIAPDFVTGTVYDARNGQREIDYATVNFADFKVANPTDEQLMDFYKKNPQTVPEMRAVSYVFVQTEMAQPDKYDEGYATAVKVEDDIIAGESMKDAAKKHNVKYVALDLFNRDNRPVDKILTDKMVEKIFDMDEGLESEMIETKDGFVFVRVDKVVSAHTAEFDDVKKSLIAGWKKEEQKKQAYVRANELLVDLNKNQNLPGKKTVVVSRTSGAPLGVLSVAFRADLNANSIVPSDDAFYVLSVKKEIAPKQEKSQISKLQIEMDSLMNTMIMEDYNSFLKRQYPVEINEKVFNRFFAK